MAALCFLYKKNKIRSSITYSHILWYFVNLENEEFRFHFRILMINRSMFSIVFYANRYKERQTNLYVENQIFIRKSVKYSVDSM